MGSGDARKGKGKKKGGSGAQRSDPRFAFATNPRFKRISKHKRTVLVDDRFSEMFTDEAFSTLASRDARGKKVNKTQVDSLSRLYHTKEEDEAMEAKRTARLEARQKGKEEEQGTSGSDAEDESTDSSDESDSEGEGEGEAQSLAKAKVESEDGEEDDAEDKEEEGSDSGSGESEGDGEDAGQNWMDLARGIGNESSSDTDSSDSDYLDVDDGTGGAWAKLQEDIVMGEDMYKRVALCNMDWDNIRAVDIYVLANSFKPPTGAILSVSVYPSMFGKERMAVEEVEGPARFIREADVKSKSIGAELEAEKLRYYQMERLKYFYAVIECDSVETASAIYQACDGLEYEMSSNVMDLRFIPDDVTFDDPPRDVATSLPSAEGFQPAEFMTSALQQSQVQLTWDNDDQQRLKVTKRKFTKSDLKDIAFKDYIASSSSEDSDEGEAEKSKSAYQALVQGIRQQHEEDDQDGMEITWDVGLKEQSKSLVEKALEKKQEGELTIGERLKKKQKEKKKARQQKQKAGAAARSDSDGSDDGLDEEEMNDPFFAEELAKLPPKPSTKSKAQKRHAVDVGGDEDGDGDGESGILEGDAAMDAVLHSDDESAIQHFDMAQVAKNEKRSARAMRKLAKRKPHALTNDTFEFNEADDRFDALFDNSEFSVDPTHPKYVDTKAMKKIIGEKQKRRAKQAKRGDKPKTQGSVARGLVEKLKQRYQSSVGSGTKKAKGKK
eukprot:m.156620 g.156620  ORF g.156620 m.156620 type:complete len:723 (-) comp14329_c0_seq1:3002-5170(-)